MRFLQVSEGQKDYATKIRHVKYWREHFAGKTLRSLTSECILSALPTHRADEYRAKTPLTASTRNRYLSTIMRILHLCKEWGWITQAPKVTKFKEPAVRVRWISQTHAMLFLSAISQDWMRDICAFGLATGMRAGEILALQWNHVDLKNQCAWLTADQTKSSRARSVPLNGDALLILNRRKGLHPSLVFTRNSGRKIQQIDARIFFKACQKIGIINFHFHDLRHTWASWHAQAGTPLFILKELGGWETLEMIKKYAHLNPEHLASHAKTVTFWSQQTLETEPLFEK